MDDFGRKFDSLTSLSVTPKATLARRSPLVRFLFLLLLLGLVDGRAAAVPGADPQNGAVPSVGPGPSFAIADFDGDQHPDLVSVQAGRIGSSFTDYWIQLQLSASGRQAIQLVAPSGGLLIQARDVNGDHAIDLVLATAWFKQPVAILLNDGHGRFSRVEPTAFPGAFTDSTTNWASSSDQGTEPAAVPAQPRSEVCAEARNLPDVRGPADSIPASSSGFLLDSFLIACAGRAPPSELPYL